MDENHLVMKKYPILEWIFGLIFIGVGIWVALQPDGLITGIIAIAVGVLFGVILASINTVIIDKTQGVFTIRQRKIYQNKVNEIPLSDVDTIDLETHRSLNKGRTSTTYRLVVLTRSGERVPLTSSYSSGYLGKANQAKKLREFLTGQKESLMQAAMGPTLGRAVQQAAVAQSGPSQPGTTDGVTWRLDTVTFGAIPVTRWIFDQLAFPGQFLLLAQKPKGSGNLFGSGQPSGLLGGLSQMVYRQLVSMYGFNEYDTPGLDAAQPLTGVDANLDDNYASLTSDPYGARQLLTPWSVMPLVNWAQQHPLKRIQTGGAGQVGQIVALFSPNGLYVCAMGLTRPEMGEPIKRLGIDIVRSLVNLQGASS